MPMLTIKNATHEDIPYILEAQALAKISEFVSPISENDFPDILDDSNQQLLLAVSDEGKNVGFAHISGLQNINHSVELRKLGVSVPGQGYGKIFLNLIKEKAFTEYNANRLWLDVFLNNTLARNLYKKLGFIEEGVMRDAYLWHGEFRSLMIMSILKKEYNA